MSGASHDALHAEILYHIWHSLQCTWWLLKQTIMCLREDLQ